MLINSNIIYYIKKYIKKVWLKFGKYIYCGVYLYKQKQNTMKQALVTIAIFTAIILFNLSQWNLI